MRDIFIKHLTQEAHLDDEIMLIVGDLGYSVIEDFQSKNPFKMVSRPRGGVPLGSYWIFL